ncbi:MAG: 4-hydroxythreonine-4-phosphate dehydrogenase PdxA [Cyanobacteria bacterium P01_H01_bin.15]
MNPVSLGLTCGDPAGIGPEVLLKALANPAFANLNLRVYGSRSQLCETYAHLKRQQPHLALAHPDELILSDIDAPTDITLGQGSAATGDFCFRILLSAIADANQGNIQGIVTAPIAKNYWHDAGHHYPGQTEVLAEKSGSNQFGMMFVAESPHTHWQLRAILATTHIPLADVPRTLTPELLTRKLDLLITVLQNDFAIPPPKILIAGLNPHSGEQGKLGREEMDWINPWLSQMRDRYPQAHLVGPLPPDTMWIGAGQAWFNSSTPNPADAYFSLYHDQGLIPVKLLAFDRAINTTVGLPFVRTSPDHGTAFDIAGQGIAEATSFEAAIQLAHTLSLRRLQSSSAQLTALQP